MEPLWNKSQPQTRVEGATDFPSDEKASVTAFPGDGEWHHLIVAFLRHHPNSSLLAVVQHLWPDFLSYPIERRARIWFRVKAQLLAMERIGVLQCEMCDTDVSVWALRSS